LNYFGEFFDSDSGEGRLMDDNMQNPKNKINVKQEVLSVIKLIIETKSIYKQKDIVDILIGDSNALLSSHKISESKFFGIGKSKNKDFWNSVIWFARVENMITKKIESFGSLTITEKGLKYLDNSIDLMMPLVSEQTESNKSKDLFSSGLGEKNLMIKLKALRKKIADINSIPPYVIFQDSSLTEMTIKYPLTIDELCAIFGVGEGKAKKYGSEFLDVISKHVKENNIARPEDIIVKSAGKNSSLKLFIIQSIDRKLSLLDIAESKSLEMMDLISEMQTIVYSGTKLDLSYCIDEYIDEEQQEELHDYFIDSETDEIEKALEEFDGEYEEFELKLFRIKFLSDFGN
jgi:ATP-dependent DNA helicase RecQ